MAIWDREDLLARVRMATRRPQNDREVSDVQWCRWLSEAQDHWHRNLCQHIPWIHWSDPVAMVSVDGGRSWRVTDVTEFVGPVQVRHGRTWGPIMPSEEYMLDGVNAVVRIPLEASWSFTPYIRYAAPLEEIRASTDAAPSEPSLRPVSARTLIVYHAAELYARSGGTRDPAPYVAAQQKEWLGDPNLPGAIGILDTLKNQYAHQEAELSEGSSGLWYRSPDLR